MASTALERVRDAHEEIETLVGLAASALAARDGGPAAPLAPRAPRTPLEASQLARALIDHAALKSKHLADQYADPAGPLADAARAAKLPANSHGAAYLRPFYDKLREVRAAHRDAHTAPPADAVAAPEQDALAALPPLPAWNPEEANGTCLDLLPHHAKFAQLAAEKIDYVAYVRAALVETDTLKPKVRRAKVYAQYLQQLLDYLTDFAERAYPLDGVTALVREEENRLLGEQQAQREVLVARFRNNHQQCLQALGVDGVGARLAQLALKTGGRPEDRAKRLLDHAKANVPSRTPVLEGLVKYLCVQVLPEERVATAHNAEKKLALSYHELEAERVRARAAQTAPAAEVQNAQQAEANAESDGALYNPKDVPLGWDGKPMPYWLYKLHGLNHDYTCEICGGAVYRGPRAFERHFSGAQHVAGLRCLGIRYSKAFLMVTSISDAVALHNRLHKSSADNAPDAVECEDANGNVSLLGRKTVDDMARQGLL